MSERNDGGPAFPWEVRSLDSAGQERTQASYGGMSLRDYFAAKAMQGLIASNDEGAGDRIEELPEYAYMIADAMLQERER